MPLIWRRPDSFHRLLAAWIGVSLLPGLSGQALAETNVSGKVQDFITGQPVAGAQVNVIRAGTVLASGATGTDGVFQLLVDVPVRAEPLALNLSASKTGFEAASQQVTVTAGQASQLSFRISLLRSEARDCNPVWARTIIVGHVRPPVSATGELALTQRISEVLQYDLLAEVQRTRLPASHQPVVLPCPDARPKTLAENAYWAKALKADAFLVGTAEPVDGKFRVDLQVSALDEAPAMPVRASTPPLNLNRPESADLGAAALEPVVFALLKAYQKEKRYAECVEFAMAAQRLLGANPRLISQRQACQAGLPNNGLVGGGVP